MRDLNNALHDLHALADWPSLDEMSTRVRVDRRTPLSKTTLSRLFSEPKLPSGRLLLAVVEYLASQAYRLDLDKVCDRFDLMWRLALDEDNPPSPGPDLGPDPARPLPRGPRPSGAPAADADPGVRPSFSLLDLDDLRPSKGDHGQRTDAPESLLMIDLMRPWPDRVLRGWSEALSMAGVTSAEQPTSSDMRRRIAAQLDAPSDTVVLLLRAPVAWDSETGEAHFLTRDSELDDYGTLWNTVSYTEIQYAISQSAARAVFVIVLAGRDPRITTATVPIAKTQWTDTLYAQDGLSRTDVFGRPAFLLWLRHSADADYSDALLEELQSNASPHLTAGGLCDRLRAVNERFGLPAPYAAARHGGEAIAIGRKQMPHFALRPGTDDLIKSTPEAWHVRRRLESNAEMPQTQATASAMGRIAGIDVIVAARGDGSLQLWDPHTGGLIQTLTESTPPITALAIGRTGNRDFIVAGSRDQTIVIWEVVQM